MGGIYREGGIELHLGIQKEFDHLETGAVWRGGRIVG